MANLDFYFDYSSPFAYLAATQVEGVAQAGHAELTWRPFLLGGLFKAIGTSNVPLFEMPPVKQAYQRLDMQRWAAHYGVEFSFPSRFPMNSVTALRMTLQLPQQDMPKLALPIFQAYWAEDRDIASAEELSAIADGAGFSGAELLAGCKEPPIKLALREATEAAEAQGICGAPSFVVRDEGLEMLFWGQDRLVMVEKALAGWRPSCG